MTEFIVVEDYVTDEPIMVFDSQKMFDGWFNENIANKNGNHIYKRNGHLVRIYKDFEQ